jgi:Uncharacterized conserved protein (DUF2190)
MADYVPYHSPGHEITQTASAAITGGQTLMNSGPGTVAPAAAASLKYIGVAAHDAASGDKVTVISVVGAIHETTAQGAITAGDLLKVGTIAGTVAALGVGTFDQFIGVAITTVADGATARWKAVR